MIYFVFFKTMNDTAGEKLATSFDEKENDLLTSVNQIECDNSDVKEQDTDNRVTFDESDFPNEEEEDEEEEKEKEKVETIHTNIFLQTTDNAYAPYTANCMLLNNATILVILSQVIASRFYRLKWMTNNS